MLVRGVGGRRSAEIRRRIGRILTSDRSARTADSAIARVLSVSGQGSGQRAFGGGIVRSWHEGERPDCGILCIDVDVAPSCVAVPIAVSVQVAYGFRDVMVVIADRDLRRVAPTTRQRGVFGG